MNIESLVHFESESQSALLTINRPQKRNSLTDEMLECIARYCTHIEQSDTIRSLIITGAGHQSFCAGGDINAWSALDAAHFGRHWVRNGHQALDQLARLSVPVIAVLNGDTLGGGLELAATADYRIAESHIYVGQPESGLGIIPGWSGTQRAVRRFGSTSVKRMALFGETFNAEQSLALGIVDKVVDPGEGIRAARKLADSIVTKAPVATELTKALINSAEGEEQERVAEFLAAMVAASSNDLQVGLQAFFRKKKPDYS